MFIALMFIAFFIEASNKSRCDVVAFFFVHEKNLHSVAVKCFCVVVDQSTFFLCSLVWKKCVLHCRWTHDVLTWPCHHCIFCLSWNMETCLINSHDNLHVCRWLVCSWQFTCIERHLDFYISELLSWSNKNTNKQHAWTKVIVFSLRQNQLPDRSVLNAFSCNNAQLETDNVVSFFYASNVCWQTILIRCCL